MDKLLSIVQHTGWVFLNCRVDCHQKIDRLQAALVQVTEQFADALAKVLTNVRRTNVFIIIKSRAACRHRSIGDL